GRPLLERERVLGPLLLAPAAVYIILLVGFPFLFAIYLSLTDATVGRPVGTFVGLQNFADVLASRSFTTALKNTFVFTLTSQVLIIVLANVLALALHRDFRGKGLVMF